jgi:hypothetical protein
LQFVLPKAFGLLDKRQAVGLLGNVSSDLRYVSSVSVSNVPRFKLIRLQGCNAIVTHHSLGLGEDGFGHCEVGLRLPHKRIPKAPAINFPHREFLTGRRLRLM